ncbi:MAG TPA: hypothetical protein VMX36_08675 [Sedimentisphaerales bacterium]|nr:hypothetical protein [Sedimentisphaerales bacterium]
MKNKREILLLGLGTLCLVTLISCNEKADEEAPVGELIIEPLAGIGPVKFGMSKEEVIKHFGQPDKVLADGTKLNYVSSRGLSFTVDSELGMQEISCWSKGMLPSRITTFAGRTKEGIGIGATQEQIVAAYGPPDRISTGSKGVIQNLHYDKLSAKFSLQEGKLMAMILEAPK